MAFSSKHFAAVRIPDISKGILPGEPGVRVTVPANVNCSRVVIENMDTVNDVWLQTDVAEPTSYKVISKGLELDINAKSNGDAIFTPGEVLGWLLAQGGGTGAVTITFTR